MLSTTVDRSHARAETVTQLQSGLNAVRCERLRFCQRADASTPIHTVGECEDVIPALRTVQSVLTPAGECTIDDTTFLLS